MLGNKKKYIKLHTRFIMILNYLFKDGGVILYRFAEIVLWMNYTKAI